MKDRRLALIFPGIGYHKDKPLLYYSRKLMEELGYEVMELEYGEEFREISEACERIKGIVIPIVNEIDWNEYDDILFVSKSVGTKAAGEAAAGIPVPVRNIFFTPIDETLPYLREDSLVFSGEEDHLVSIGKLKEVCNSKEAELHLYPEANHSLETGDTIHNLELLKEMIGICRIFINKSRVGQIEL